MLKPNERGFPVRFNLFFHFLSRHLAVLAIIAAVGIPLYALVISDIRKNEIHNRLDRLNRFRNQIEAEFRKVDDLVFNLAWSPEMNRILVVDTLDFGSSNVYRTMELNQYLSNQLASNSFPYDVAVFFQSSQILVSARWIVLRMPFYYGGLFEIIDVDYESWKSRYLENPMKTTSVSFVRAMDRSQELSLILYARKLSLGESRDATILVMLDEQRVHELFAEAGITTGGRFQIVTQTGEVLSYSDFAESFEGRDPLRIEGRQAAQDRISLKDVITLEATIQSRGWNIRADVPQREILASLWSTSEAVAIAISAALVLGLVSSVIFAYQASNPLRRVLSRVHALLGESGGEEGKGGIALVEREVSALLEHNQVMGRRLQEQRKAVKAVYIDRLLKGQVDREEIDTISSMLGIDFRIGKIAVAVLSLNRDPASFPVQRDSSWEGLSLVIQDQLMQNLPSVADAQALEQNRIVAFLRVRPLPNKTAYEVAQSDLLASIDELRKQLHVNIIAGVGIIASSSYDIWRSFLTATQAVEDGGSISHDRLVQIASTMGPSSGYYYPLELETELTKLTKAGETDDVDETLESILRENRRRSLELSDEKAFVAEIQATIRKIAAPLSIERRLIEIRQQDGRAVDWDMLHGDLSRVFHEICAVVNRRKSSHNRALADRIRQFVKDNYTDPQLSLGLVASEFSLSESYVSHIFAEQTGEQYSRYVESVRMESARELLEQGTSRVEDIAAAVGYTSVHGFRRAFKRVVGYNPLDVRRAARIRI